LEAASLAEIVAVEILEIRKSASAT